MTEIKFTTQTPISFTKKGSALIGKCSFGSRNGDYETYAVRLSKSAFAMLEYGDILTFGTGKCEWCVCDATGEILKPDGTRIKLTGTADIGIDTGHPPHLKLEYVQTWKLQWDTCPYEYEKTLAKLPLTLWEKDNQFFIENDGRYSPWNIPTDPNNKAKIQIEKYAHGYKNPDGYMGHTIFWLVKTIQKADSDEPMIYKPDFVCH